MIFDENVYTGQRSAGQAVRAGTPSLCPRDTLTLPAGIKTETGPGGVLTFPELPFAVQARLFYDPVNKRLGFKGVWISAEGEEPWLLPNLMTAAERDTIQTFTPWQPPRAGALRSAISTTRPGTRTWFPIRPDTTNGKNPFDATQAVRLRQVGNQAGPAGSRQPGTAIAARSVIGEKNALSAGMAQGEGHVVIAENNDPALNDAPVALHVIQDRRIPRVPGDHQGDKIEKRIR